MIYIIQFLERICITVVSAIDLWYETIFNSASLSLCQLQMLIDDCLNLTLY